MLKLSPLSCQFPPSLSPCVCTQVTVTHLVVLFFILMPTYLGYRVCLWDRLLHTFISLG